MRGDTSQGRKSPLTWSFLPFSPLVQVNTGLIPTKGAPGTLSKFTVISQLVERPASSLIRNLKE